MFRLFSTRVWTLSICFDVFTLSHLHVWPEIYIYICTGALILRIFNAVFPNLSDVAVPLTSLFISHGTPWGKRLFFKFIYCQIISYVVDKVVYCCWVSIYALINDVILFIYLSIYLFFISTFRGTPRKCSRYPRVPRNHVGNHWFNVFFCPCIIAYQYGGQIIRLN
jgi:hypothetical protein